MKKIVQLLRIKEWLFSKLPFMFVPFFIIAEKYEGSLFQSGEICVSYLIYLFFFYGFGYAINDYSDREIDRKVGKTNIMGELTQTQCWLILLLLTAGGFQFAAVCNNITAWLSMTFVYFWGAAYSVRPFRFKERGIGGLLVSSLAQRTIPFLPLLGVSDIYLGPVVVCGLIGFFVGLRYILIHQYEDMKNDELSGTSTYVSDGHRNISWAIYLSLVLEVILILVLEGIYVRSWIGMLLAMICAVETYFTYNTVQHIYKKEYFLSFVCVPLEDMYNFYLPLTLLLELVCRQYVWIIPLAVLVLLTAKGMKDKWKTAVFGITHRRRQ